MLPAPRFHHLHLRSTDPGNAIDFHVRQFPTCTRGTWAVMLEGPSREGLELVELR